MGRKKVTTPVPGFAHATLDAIETAVLELRDDEDRWHLGASLIGRDCPRFLWYVFHWAHEQEPEARMVRLWARGDREEATFAELLQQCGIIVQERDPDTGKQFRISDHNGHFGGSLDSMLYGVIEFPAEWMLGEYKTHNDKSFAKLKVEGVRSAKFEHFIQMQVYMRKRGLKRALYCAVNKNDDHLHLEIVELDEREADKYIERAGWIIGLSEPPAGISTDPTFWDCAYCDARDVCHGRAMPRVNCRTCAHVTPVENGAWHCAFHNIHFTKPETDQPSAMLYGCPAHVFNPGILHNSIEYLGASDPHHAQFRMPDGRIVVNGPAFDLSIDIKLVD